MTFKFVEDLLPRAKSYTLDIDGKEFQIYAVHLTEGAASFPHTFGFWLLCGNGIEINDGKWIDAEGWDYGDSSDEAVLAKDLESAHTENWDNLDGFEAGVVQAVRAYYARKVPK